MRDRRDFRKPKDRLVLGQIEYQIEEVEGCGSSSIVYRADYEDSLNAGQRHQVLIKELYPWTPDDSVYRDEAGRICCTDEGSALLEQGRESFYRGNAANLELLRTMPDKISGNLNSYEAYGTYYSVLALHGGRNLQEVLEEEDGQMDLQRMAQILLQILDALEGFHKAGILHLDISPDNILLLSTHALLIDYNSVWVMDSDPSKFTFSEKPGYVSPEVRLREFSNIGPRSDLYSVTAIFFRMVTGRRLETADTMGKGLKKSLHRDLPVFQDAPVTAAQMAVQILGKGLHVLARKRYQSVREMRADVQELLLRIDRKGVTEASLWEGSRREWRLQEKSTAPGGPPGLRSQKLPYMSRDLRMERGKVISEEQVRIRLEEGGLLLLHGAGGLGKTQFLKALWKDGVSVYRKDCPIVCYVPLSGYQEAGAEPYYIRKYLLRRLTLLQQEDTLEVCMQELDQLTQDPKAHRWILLLDGLNEAGTHTELLLKEIEDLGRQSQIGILVTDRTDGVKQYGLTDFRTMELMPLSEALVESCLAQNGLDYPENDRLSAAISNPMLLNLYIETKKMSAEGRSSISAGTSAAALDRSRSAATAEGNPGATRTTEDVAAARTTEDIAAARRTGTASARASGKSAAAWTAGKAAGKSTASRTAKDSDTENAAGDQTSSPSAGKTVAERKRTAGSRYAASSAGASAGLQTTEASAASDEIEEIVWQYMDTLCTAELRRDSGDKTAQLRHRYLLEHLLPEIAWTMKQKNRTLFTLEELTACLRKDYQTLRSKAFSAAFPEYLGKSRLMLGGIADEREWFDYCITEQLVEKMGLLEEVEGLGYGFLHDIFIDALAVRGKENHAKITRAKRKSRLKWGALAAVVVVLIVCAVGFFVTSGREETLSAEEEEILLSAAIRLEINMGIVDTQLSGQEVILEELSDADVLAGETDALSDMLEMAQLQIDTITTRYAAYSSGSSYVTELEELGVSVPANLLTELYTAPEEMQQFYSQCLILILERFCEEDSVYNTADKREPLVEAYEDYLSAWKDIYYLKYDRYLTIMEELGAEETAEELMQAMQQSASFTGCIITYSLGGLTEDEYEKKLEAAQTILEEAQRELAEQNML